ncbi:glycosyl hydrolase family 8 [Bacillaceae bacterium S4-13-56]
MKRYKYLFFTLLILVICITVPILVIFSLSNDDDHTQLSISEPSVNELIVETFIKNWMFNSNGTMKTNLQDYPSKNPEIARGEDALSESLGLWMLYALEKKDSIMFESAYVTLKEHFLTKEHLVLWKVSSNKKEEIYTNALIDDLRIIEALMAATDLWGIKKYSEEAEAIGKNIVKHQISNNYFTDYYDSKVMKEADILTLSYLKPKAIHYLMDSGQIDDKLFNTSMDLLKNIPYEYPFYPKRLHIIEETYEFEDEINLIDQVYIAYHQAQIKHINQDFLNFLKQEFHKEGALFGRYNRSTNLPTVNYESPALYGLTILFALESNENDFARDLYYRMVEFQTKNPESKYYGGYIDYNIEDSHIFDNVIPLLAERKLINEGVLQ